MVERGIRIKPKAIKKKKPQEKALSLMEVGKHFRRKELSSSGGRSSLTLRGALGMPGTQSTTKTDEKP